MRILNHLVLIVIARGVSAAFRILGAVRDHQNLLLKLGVKVRTIQEGSVCFPDRVQLLRVVLEQNLLVATLGVCC